MWHAAGHSGMRAAPHACSLIIPSAVDPSASGAGQALGAWSAGLARVDGTHLSHQPA